MEGFYNKQKKATNENWVEKAMADQKKGQLKGAPSSNGDMEGFVGKDKLEVERKKKMEGGINGPQ